MTLNHKRLLTAIALVLMITPLHLYSQENNALDTDSSEVVKEQSKKWWHEGNANISLIHDFDYNIDKIVNELTGTLYAEYDLHYKGNRWAYDLRSNLFLKYIYDDYFNAVGKLRKKSDNLNIRTEGAYELAGNMYINIYAGFYTDIMPIIHYTTVNNETVGTKMGGFLSPAYIDASPGIQWRFSESEELFFTMGVSPASLRFVICTFNNDDSRRAILGDYYWSKGAKIASEFGASGIIQFSWKKEKFSGNTRFTLYAPYRKYGEKYDIDANLRLRLTYQLFKMLNLNFILGTQYYNSLYHTYAMSEDRLTKKASFKELVNIDYTFSLGLGFNF